MLLAFVSGRGVAQRNVAVPVPTQPELEEIIVTARKTGERLSRVPLSIESIDARRIGTGGIDSLAALSAIVPGLAFESQWGGSNAAPVLRGQSQPSLAGDAVGMFVDGVYQASRTAFDVDPIDLQRIEVVRGPQSALFGQNTFAGAIHYVPNEPGEHFESAVRLDAGSDALLGGEAVLSGPIFEGPWRARLAFASRSADGTHVAQGTREALGGKRRVGGVLTVVRGDPLANAGNAAGEQWFLRASVRYGEARLGHPPVATLQPSDYNCGGRDPVTGLWSYRCGEWPVSDRFSVSPQLPDSEQDVGQASLRIGVQLGSVRLLSESSLYRANATVIRDFDNSATGLPLGVCRVGSTCTATLGVPRVLDRIVDVNVLSRSDSRVDQWSQELRFAGPIANGHDWLLGAVAYGTRQRIQSAFGADGRTLAANEQWTALRPATPTQVGPVSPFNRARVATDPALQQVVQNLNRPESFAWAVFGAVDYRAFDALDLRAEARLIFERERLDGVISNFGPGLGRAIPEQKFRDFTPRASALWKLTPMWHSWVSAAKGTRSGGTNTVVGLDPDEQKFEPESNWTYEWGLRRSAGESSRLRRFAMTAFYIDWRNAQIVGFSNTPGIGSLITRNTQGITTRGLEISAAFALSEAVTLNLAYSGVDARFRAGSEDAGARGFCGIGGTTTTSTFCVIGPSRTPGLLAPQLVPYIDGNATARSPPHSGTASLAARVPWQPAGWQLDVRTDVGLQSDAFERTIEGARFGAYTLIDARLSATRGPWSVEIWGRNLGDDAYIRGAASRGPQFYPTTPRPYDLIHAEGRRFGIALQYRSGEKRR